MSTHSTGSQTVGPFFEIGLSWMYTRDLRTAAISGERITLRGHVYDGCARPIADALLEFWQADANGRYYPEPGAEFMGFARVPTDACGAFELRTVKPGAVTDPRGQLHAPHLNVHVFMRGLLLPLFTRIYFADEPANAKDPVLALVPEARRETLLARPNAAGFLDWDIHTQGDREIVCFVA